MVLAIDGRLAKARSLAQVERIGGALDTILLLLAVRLVYAGLRDLWSGGA